MDDILVRLGNDAADVFREDSLYGHSDGVHDILAEVNFDEMLFEPVVSNEFPLAIARFYAGEAICLSAVKLLDVFLVVVANVLAEGRLLVKPRLFPLRAIGVTNIIWTFVPSLQNGHGVLCVLHDHETSVGVGTIESIRIVLRLFLAPWIFGHGDGVFGGDIPVVHHPFDRYVEEAECGIGVKEDDEFIVFDVIGKRRWLDPCCVAIFKIGSMDEFIVITVDHGVSVMVEDTSRNVVGVAPVVFAFGKCLGRWQISGLEIENQHVAAQLLSVSWIRW